MHKCLSADREPCQYPFVQFFMSVSVLIAHFTLSASSNSHALIKTWPTLYKHFHCTFFGFIFC